MLQGLRAQSAVKASLPVMMGGNGSMLGTSIGSGFMNGMNGSNGGGPNTVLRVVVENPLYPVSLDVLSGVSGNFAETVRFFGRLLCFPDFLSLRKSGEDYYVH